MKSLEIIFRLPVIISYWYIFLYVEMFSPLNFKKRKNAVPLFLKKIL